MVREVPNYAQQYLTEHPELNPPESRGNSRLGCPAERSSPEACHPEEAQAFAKRTPANEEPAPSLPRGPLHSSAVSKKESHPERARPSRESKDPHSANTSNRAAGNSPNPSEGNVEKPCAENIPPLTTRQSERWNEIKKLEASIEGAMHGNWRDLRTAFNAVGLTPPKPPPKKPAGA